MIERHAGLRYTCTVKLCTCMFATITINRFVLLIATGSGQGPLYICVGRACICFETVTVAG